jgi:predicted HTH domain antitoxin
MEVLLNLPDDVVEKLASRWEDLPRHAVEALAADAYRSGVLTSYEVQRMLGFSSRWETDDFLKSRGAYLDYTEEDLRQDLATLQKLGTQ